MGYYLCSNNFTMFSPNRLHYYRINYLILYPNPVSNSLNLSSIYLIDHVEIYNLLGTLVKSLKGNVETIDMSDLSNGNYVVKVATKNGLVIKKIIKN